MKKTIYIQGMCYSGKTTIGKFLSKSLNINFLDSRDIFFNLHKKYDLDYLLENGNSEFCKAENESFDKDFGHCVVALSGSALYNKELMEKISKEHILIWLNTSYNAILSRKQKEEENGIQRPIVYPHGVSTFEELYNTRCQIYDKYTGYKINISQFDSTNDVVKKIIEKLV